MYKKDRKKNCRNEKSRKNVETKKVEKNIKRINNVEKSENNIK